MKRSAAAVLSLVAVLACDSGDEVETTPAAGDTSVVTPETQTTGTQSVSVQMTNREGASAGAVHLTGGTGQVELHVQLTGIAPGEHGFHVHEMGACEPPAFESAGPHFATPGQQHGMQNPQGPHLGDLPNLRANEQGSVDTVFTVSNLTLDSGAATSLFGRALVVHADPDDYVTDPSGNSGDRIACGVIEQQ